jgi:hypothetical protein
LLAHRHTQAQYTDSGYLAWKQTCDDLTREWQRAMASPADDDTDKARFKRLVDFATTH